MTEITEPAPQKKNFDFVDTIRCLSMLGIVFEHTEEFGAANYESFYTSMLQVSVMQFFKFATIAFFLIAGFLINHKFKEYTALQYLKNRFKSTIGPWMLWINIFMIIDISNLLFMTYIKHHGEGSMPSPFISYLLNGYYNIIFKTSFWFILNFLICIAILLLFKKYIYKIGLGIALFLVSLFYSINLYHGWLATSHTTALFGFVFFLWLGAYINRHSEVVFSFIRKISYVWLIGITVLFFLMADLEIIHLKAIGNEDSYNTLRITNILYSLSFFLILLKVGSIPFVNRFFLPRKTTFGIYLTHQIIITHLLKEIFYPLHWQMDSMTVFGALGYSILRYIITYSISFLIVRLILLTKFRWSIGG
ncbi:MAG TPA: acyltransferase [Pedobacter sp.]